MIQQFGTTVTSDLFGEMKAAIELSRVWWDDTDPYRAKWNHDGFPCNRSPCDACKARAAAMAVLARLGDLDLDRDGRTPP